MSTFKIQGYFVDILARKIFYGEVAVDAGKIISIQKLQTTNNKQQTTNYILPGFIDSQDRKSVV